MKVNAPCSPVIESWMHSTDLRIFLPTVCDIYDQTHFFSPAIPSVTHTHRHRNRPCLDTVSTIRYFLWAKASLTSLSHHLQCVCVCVRVHACLHPTHDTSKTSTCTHTHTHSCEREISQFDQDKTYLLFTQQFILHLRKCTIESLNLSVSSKLNYHFLRVPLLQETQSLYQWC